MAEAAFRSTSGSLLWPIAQPGRSATKIVLRQNARDISGGDALNADSTVFTLVRHVSDSKYATTIFWAARNPGGARLVVTEEPFNWRGDWYYVFLVPAGMTPDRFANERHSEYSSLKPLLGDNRWIPPIVLEDAVSHSFWLIDRGEPYEVMPDWKVYFTAHGRLASPCRISFGYSEANGVDHRLRAVHDLAAALDEALGPGTGEGTLQQTAALRREVAKEWANASLRPWALTDEPYNSSLEVELGLGDWAKGNAKRTQLVRRINLVRPRAERELASYYAKYFNSGRAPSQRLSHRAIDHMLRS